MIKYFLALLAVFGVAWMLFPLWQDFTEPAGLNSLSNAYVQGSKDDLGIPNVVTSIVVSYRGLDTLGEVTVLFLATTGVGFLLRRRKKEDAEQVSKRRLGSEILGTGAAFLSPLIVLFGIYIFIHGHLSPGGGFQGGVVIASGLLLLLMADSDYKMPHQTLVWLESISGFGYVLLGLAGVILLGLNSFLDPRILPAGEWLRLFSGGAIPLIYSLVGLKVGSELSSIIESMQGEAE